MSQSTPQVPVEPPELIARREQLLTQLETEAKAATGTAQPVLRKLHELLTNTRPDQPFNPALYGQVHEAFQAFLKAPVLPPPAILMECMTFLQERQAAFMTALHK